MSTPRDEFSGHLRFGHSPRGAGSGGIPFTLDLGAGQKHEQGLRPEDDVGRGPQGEVGNLHPRSIIIRILAGRTGAKYSWKRVHPLPAADAYGDDKDGGGRHDGFFAKEINSRTNVGVGTLVDASYSDIGPWLNFSIGGGGGDIVHWVMPSASVVNSYGNWPGLLLQPTTEIHYEPGDEIRLTFEDILTTSTLTRLFIDGNVELGTLLGEVRETDTPSARTASSVTVSGSTTVTSATAAFTGADVGDLIAGTGIPAGATIVSVESATSVTISVPATASGTVSVVYTPSKLYPLYHARGHQRKTITMCVDGVETDFCWSIPGWIETEGAC